MMRDERGTIHHSSFITQKGIVMKLEQNNVGWVIAAFIFGAVLAVGGMTLAKRTSPAPIVITPPAPTATPPPTATPGPVQVFVNGAVAMEGVYALPADGLVEDAIEAAGGFTEEANVAVVNLAQPLSNGAQIYVPLLAEDGNTPTAVLITNSAPGNGRDAQAPSTIVNINTADAAQLETLPGVGPSTAEKIITYRNENGPFAALEDIMNVPGIGQGKFDEFKELISLSDE
jgi:competence protein ComEA